MDVVSLKQADLYHVDPLTHSGPKPRTIAARFWEHVNKTRGCWLWTGTIDSQTHYGRLGAVNSRKRVGAHVVSWLIHRSEIPSGKFVLHTCDVRHCVRPDHLFLGTQQDNMDDMWKKGRGNPGRLTGEKHHHAILTAEAVIRIIKEVKTKGRVYGLQTELAKHYGVGVTAIANVINGLTWRHLTGGRL